MEIPPKFPIPMQLLTKMNRLHFKIKRSKIRVIARPHAFIRRRHSDQRRAVDHLVINHTQFFLFRLIFCVSIVYFRLVVVSLAVKQV